jgi:hypothetical protein
MLRNALLFSLLLFGPVLYAQDARPLSEDKKADVVFEFHVDRYLEQSEKLGWKSLAIERFISRFSPEDSVVTAIRGASQLPIEGKDGFKLFSDERELTFNFSLQLEFADAASCDIMESRFAAASTKETVDGKVFYRMREPRNLVGLRAGDTKFEIGTYDFLQQSGRDFQKKELVKIVDVDNAFLSVIALPQDKLSVLIDSCKKFYREIVGHTVEIPSTTFDQMKLLSDTKVMSLSVNFSNKQMAQFHASTVDETAAKKLETDLNKTIKTMSSSWELEAKYQVQRTGESISASVMMPENAEAMAAHYRKLLKAEKELESKVLRFRKVAMAVLEYDPHHMRLPFASASRQKLVGSWRTRILPFLYPAKKVEFKNEYDIGSLSPSEIEAKFADKMPKDFGVLKPGISDIVRIKSINPVSQVDNLRDGASCTIMLIEHPKGVSWLDDVEISAEDAIKLVQGLPDGEHLVVVLYNGIVRLVGNDISERKFRNLLDPEDGNEIEGFPRTNRLVVPNSMAKRVIK